MNTEQIVKIIESGLDNYDGPDGPPSERIVATFLIEAGITVADCEDDEYALAEYVADGMPLPYQELRMSLRQQAERIANHIISTDGGFVALNLEASA